METVLAIAEKTGYEQAELEVIALPEEDTLFVNGDKVEAIGTKPYYYFQNGIREERRMN